MVREIHSVCSAGKRSCCHGYVIAKKKAPNHDNSTCPNTGPKIIQKSKET